MIRGILSTLSSRVSYSLSSVPINCRNGAFGFISKSLINQQNSNFSLLARAAQSPSLGVITSTKKVLLEPSQICPEQKRTVIKFSLKKGKRKSVRAVRERFFRLHWGAWIRTIAGRHKKLWKKSTKRRNNYMNHVFCNTTQCKMLDKMVNKFWRKPKYYIEDPYAIYHKRENFFITRKKPWRPEGVDYE